MGVLPAAALSDPLLCRLVLLTPAAFHPRKPPSTPEFVARCLPATRAAHLDAYSARCAPRVLCDIASYGSNCTCLAAKSPESARLA
tara:strand:+ start:3555 stop:3812 length:258 start_codon:yes stop_codon:yes gene_type:complete